MSIVDALEKIDRNSKGILFITDDGGHLTGCLTDGDVRRWLIRTGRLKTDISGAVNHEPFFVTEEFRKGLQSVMKKKKLTAVPIVDDRKNIIDIVFKSSGKTHGDLIKSSALAAIPVVIMAGGKGTRLYPYTKILPKPLIPVDEVPIAEHIINQFRAFGCKDFYLVVNYKKNMIKAYFNELERDYNISYADEDEPLGTGGGLSLLNGRIGSTFILSNCDIMIDEDFSKIYKYHKEHNNKITMICSLKNYKIPYGVVNLGDNGTIASMEEKPTVSFFTNTGCYIVEPDVLSMIPEKTAVGFPDIVDRVKDEGGKVGVFPISEQSWMDMGQMDTLQDMERRIEKRKAQ